MIHKETTRKKFNAVKMMREIRNKIDKETEGMNFEQLKQYYEQSTEANRGRVINKR